MKSLIALVLASSVFLNCKALHAQVITTYAGSGSYGSSGDGSAATAATMSGPHGIAVDAGGNLYICDVANQKIRKVSPSGVMSTFAGTGTAGYSGDGGLATAAKLNNPFEIAVDPQSSFLFIGDIGNAVIRKINGSGVISTFAGNGSAGFSGDGGPATSAELDGCSGVAFDLNGNVYFSDGGNHRIRKVNRAGTISTIAGTGSAAFGGDNGPATAASLHYPGFLYCNAANGDLYISDNGNHRVRKIDTFGIITTVAGNGSAGYSGDGGPATAASMNYTSGIDFDAVGNLYIGDYENNCIRRVNPSGIISTFAGNTVSGFSGDGGSATAAQLSKPTDIALSGCNKLYIADRNNNRIRVVITSPTATSFVSGDTVSLTICPSDTVNNLNALLTARDVNACESISWRLADAARHGVLRGMSAATTTSIGGVVAPRGASYIPAPSFSGRDTLRVIVSDGSGGDTLTVFLNVLPAAACRTAVPWLGQDGLQLALFPNPNAGSFTLQVLNGNLHDAILSIFDTQGRIVISKVIVDADSVEVQSNLVAGVYLAVVSNADGSRYYTRLVVE